MENFDLERLGDKLPGYTVKERFIPLVDWHINNYYNNDSFFSILIIDFDIINEKKFVINAESVLKFFSTAINTIITKHFDSYTIDDDRFVILLVDKSADFANKILNKIIAFVNQKYSEDLIIISGASECPDDAITYTGLYNAALKNNSIVNSLSEENKINHSDIISQSLTDIQNNVKANLFKELSSLIKVIHQYDPYLGEHSAIVTKGCILLSKEISLTWKEIEKLAVAALLHDIGYIAIPKEIYNKKAKLTADEWKLIKLHPTIACENILKPLSMFDDYIPLIQNHHEFLNGSGYPDGKKGNQIPLGSQIISIVDTYHAMKSDRPYRKEVPFEDIIDYYIKNAGVKWHKELITMFTAILADNEQTKSLDGNEEFNINALMQAG
ncbi:MAG: HD domain-containing phosphohydrolase [Candidatus Gastranaerophilaceae bacterium]|jgi:HD-GYP domain-containing protein (c-di-GMP phosphodiesterase class II)